MYKWQEFKKKVEKTPHHVEKPTENSMYSMFVLITMCHGG